VIICIHFCPNDSKLKFKKFKKNNFEIKFTYLTNDTAETTKWNLCPLFLKGLRKISIEHLEVIHMGSVQLSEKVNDTCMKTVHAGTMDRDFTVLKMTFLTTLHHMKR
jgi:hypothetical protein